MKIITDKDIRALNISPATGDSREYRQEQTSGHSKNENYIITADSFA